VTYTINPKDPHGLLCVLGEASIEFDNEGAVQSKALIDELRDQLREQVKPAVEQPTEFGSIVRAGLDGLSDRVLWQRWARGGWQSEEGAFVASFDFLDHPEVLRVGIGEPPEQDPALDQAYGNGQYAGWGEALSAASRKLRTIRAEVITSERKSAYDTAIRTVEELQP